MRQLNDKFLAGSFHKFPKEYQSWQIWWKILPGRYYIGDEPWDCGTLLISRSFRCANSLTLGGTQWLQHKHWTRISSPEKFLKDLLQVPQKAPTGSELASTKTEEHGTLKKHVSFIQLLYMLPTMLACYDIFYEFHLTIVEWVVRNRVDTLWV